jgi:hypothetical protein
MVGIGKGPLHFAINCEKKIVHIIDIADHTIGGIGSGRYRVIDDIIIIIIIIIIIGNRVSAVDNVGCGGYFEECDEAVSAHSFISDREKL